MPTGNYEICNSYKIELFKGYHKDTDSYYIALFNDTANLNKNITSYSGLVGEVSNGNGYITGGKLLQGLTIFLDNDTAIMDFTTDPVWLGSITARFALIYNNTLINKSTLGVIDFGQNYSSINNEFKIVFPVPTETTALFRII